MDEEVLLRQMAARSARRARPRGHLTENDHPVRPKGVQVVELRENARFSDQTYESLIGAVGGSIATMTTGAGP